MPPRFWPFALANALLTAGCGGSTTHAVTSTAVDGDFRVLLFSRTVGYRHESIPAAIGAFMDMQAAGAYQAEATEDARAFTAVNLGRFQVVVFLMTTGNVLDSEQQTAFEMWVNAGGSFLGVHSASDTEYDWPFYGQLVGAYFSGHPEIQPATVVIEGASHPAVEGLPSPWRRRDEWYDFRTHPSATATVLATVDESSYAGGSMGPDHPMVWVQETAAGGRVFYTGMGHTRESYAESAFRRHLMVALRWLGHAGESLASGDAGTYRWCR